jgi:hypothetical protein
MLYESQIVNTNFTKKFGIREPMYACDISFEKPENSVLFYKCTFKGSGCIGALKIFASRNFIFKECKFYSGASKCLSIISSSCIKFIDCIFNIDKNFDLDISSGSHKILFNQCVFNNLRKNKLWAFLLGKWSSREMIWRPPVRDVNFKDCKFGKRLRSGLCIRSYRPNISMVRPWTTATGLAFLLARKILPKDNLLKYSLHETEF